MLKVLLGTRLLRCFEALVLPQLLCRTHFSSRLMVPFLTPRTPSTSRFALDRSHLLERQKVVGASADRCGVDFNKELNFPLVFMLAKSSPRDQPQSKVFSLMSSRRAARSPCWRKPAPRPLHCIVTTTL